MVFGRKSAPVKPQPPGVEEILQDLSRATAFDPVYTLVPSLARDVVEEETETKENTTYKTVVEYLEKEKKLEKLQSQVGEGFDTLVTSQKELKKLTGEVQDQLENLKEARGKLCVAGGGVLAKPVLEESTTGNRTLDDSEPDLC